MSESIALPDASSDSGTPAFTGGASAHAVMGDLDDATYATYNDAADESTLAFGSYSPAIPGDAIIKNVSAYVRAKGGRLLRTKLNMSEVGPPILVAVDQRVVNVNSFSVLQFVGAQLVRADIDPDNASVEVQPYGTGGTEVQITTVFLSCRYIEKPTLVVDAPTGTITDSTNPRVTFTPTLDTDGGALFATAIKIFDEATYTDPGFDPDTSNAVASTLYYGQDTEWRIPVALADGDYRAYAQVYQFPVNGETPTSDWEYSGFTMDVDRPGVPGFDVTPEDAAGRVLLTFEDTAGETTTDGLHIQHQDQHGEWEDIRTELGDGLVALDEGSYYDYEAPNGTVTWRARAYHEFAADEVSYSDWVEDTDTVACGWWLKHPARPQLNVGVTLRSFPGHSRASRQSVVQPLGRPDAVAIGDTRGPQTGTVVIACENGEVRDAVMALATETSPVLLQQHADADEPDRWVILGDEQVERLVDKSYITERDITYEWTEVARPTTPLAYAGLYPDDLLFPDDDLYPH